MRKLNAMLVVAAAALIAGPAQAADPIQYEPIDYPVIPDVNYGLEGSFYLRGSAGMNAWTAKDGSYCGCILEFDTPGYGYSVGAGFGYETGDGIRADITFDYLDIQDLTSTTDHTVDLRSGLALANIYYDFSLDGSGGSAEGGMGVYVGAGIGLAKNFSYINDSAGAEIAWGKSLEGAVALMAGVSYDMGDVVADLGYRGIYMNKVMSQPDLAADAYIINDNYIHEVRGTVRYRFN